MVRKRASGVPWGPRAAPPVAGTPGGGRGPLADPPGVPEGRGASVAEAQWGRKAGHRVNARAGPHWPPTPCLPSPAWKYIKEDPALPMVVLVCVHFPSVKPCVPVVPPLRSLAGPLRTLRTFSFPGKQQKVTAPPVHRRRRRHLPAPQGTRHSALPSLAAGCPSR